MVLQIVVCLSVACRAVRARAVLWSLGHEMAGLVSARAELQASQQGLDGRLSQERMPARLYQRADALEIDLVPARGAPVTVALERLREQQRRESVRYAADANPMDWRLAP